ncbi:hypothetical protein [Acinetobacter sp. ANC 4169]|jgi:hypothetical protein|uniref:hypothetical protein n=1 Tax=Acinetobacter sp. ANC 4169 TaxID=1977879 RepID=UPI001D0D314A|nr:hypothetical protein [Acinetobacter sp. ANC 4169]
MNQKSLKWGIGITVIWLSVIIAFWIFGGLTSPKSLNELGDFLAGIFAPVAFLWLILGYVQQGKQLDQNTKALEQQERALQLQIDEMRESVKQQAELAKIQREQLESLHQSVQPELRAIKGYWRVEQEEDQLLYIMTLSVQNIGKGMACNLHVINKANGSVIYSRINDIPTPLSGASIKVEENVEISFPTKRREGLNTLNDKFLVITLKYKDLYENLYEKNFQLKFDDGAKGGKLSIWESYKNN